MSVSSACTVATVLSAVLVAQGPPRVNPSQVGITYPIVACKMPNPANVVDRTFFPEAFNHSLYVNSGTKLVLIYPDGSEHVIFDPAAHGMPNGGVVDPCVSFDGTTIYFACFVDAQNLHNQRHLSTQPSRIWKLEVTASPPSSPVVSGVTQLTNVTTPDFQGTAPNQNPNYAAFDLAPLELPDGRILFLSTRDATFASTQGWNDLARPAPSFWRMNPDGTSQERVEGFSQAGCQHPFILKDGRVVWTHRHDAGRRQQVSGNYPLMVATQDLADFKTLAGPHHHANAFHFGTQLSNGDIVVCTYYHNNNFGHGPLLRFPVDAPGGPGTNNPYFQNMEPISQIGGQYDTWNYNEHFKRIGESLSTPWSMGPGFSALGDDNAAPFLNGVSGERVGKPTMPAAAPPTSGAPNLLLVWSPGGVNVHNNNELPSMKVAYAIGGTAVQRDDLRILKESVDASGNPLHHYLYPKPLVTYAAIYGVPRPAWIPDTANAGAHPALPAGSPFATTGTSSLYNRESEWPTPFQDEWDLHPADNHRTYVNVGADSFAVRQTNGRWALPINDPVNGAPLIYGAQVVADMARVDTYYQTWSQSARYLTHNNGRQIWGVLGEIPVRKKDDAGQTILDPQGNPDTSYEVRIPAMVPFHHRALDANGMMLTTELTWHSTKPGERKNNCGGCHAHSREKQPLDFQLTAAAQDTYQVTDFALQTPVLDQTAGGTPIVTNRPEKIWVVEYHQDVRPIFTASCATTGCHTTATKAGNLDLEAADAWRWLAYEPTTGTGHPFYRVHQATRWVRKNSARQSLLAWKVFGARLDGRTNADRGNDVDYTGTAMPPSTHPQLTHLDKRKIALWIDLGCVVDVDGAKTIISRDDPFDDQMRPTLVVSGIEPDHNEYPVPPLRVSAYDLHSGVKANSLVVKVNSVTQPNMPTLADGAVVTVPLQTQLLPEQTYTIEISVADNATGNGNIARRTLTVVPRALKFSQPAMVGGAVHTLNVSQADPGSGVFYFGTTTGMGNQPCYGGLCLDLDAPVYLGMGVAGSDGTSMWSYTMPNVPGADVIHQAAAAVGGVLRKTRPLIGKIN